MNKILLLITGLSLFTLTGISQENVENKTTQIKQKKITQKQAAKLKATKKPIHSPAHKKIKVEAVRNKEVEEK